MPVDCCSLRITELSASHHKAIISPLQRVLSQITSRTTMITVCWTALSPFIVMACDLITDSP